MGGYITASQDVIDYLRIYARSNMFSTSLPPSVCAAAIEVIKVMQSTEIVEHLKQNAEYLQNKLKSEGFNIMNTETPHYSFGRRRPSYTNSIGKGCF